MCEGELRSYRRRRGALGRPWASVLAGVMGSSQAQVATWYKSRVSGTPDFLNPRHDLVERSVPFLPPGSEIRQVFIAQAAPSFGFFLVTYLTGLTMFWIKYRCVAVTKDAIYVLESSKPSGGAKPQSLVATLPRHTQLGPVSGRWGQMNLLGERHWVHKRFHDQVTAADHEAGLTQKHS
jgi:hypothetical protein